MNPRILLPLLVAPLLAGEHTVETQPFRIERSFTASAMPEQAHVLRLEPETWGDFTIEVLAEHGSPIKQGEVVVGFEREAYEQRLDDLKREIRQKELALATQQLAFDKLKLEVALQLEAARRAKEIAAEDLAYFKATGRPAEEASAAERVKQFEFRLEAEEEELKQLTQMYEEDDLTEQTEEIILDRQKFSVASAKFDLEQTKRQVERSLKTTLPRRAEQLERAAKEAGIAWEKAEENLPRSVEAAELELTGARVALERQKLELERLSQDGPLLQWQSPVDGVVFHGSLEDGQWALGDLAKALVVGGKLPVRRGLISVVPGGDALPLHARLEAAVARTLAPEMSVGVTIPGREDLALSGTIARLDRVPGTDGKHGAAVAIEWPDDCPVPPTSQAECVAVIYDKPDALVVPVKALSAGADGAWTVEVKLADGATERRTVERGRSTAEQVEVVAGLEAGQVIVTPE
mgnify:CR=1 FL=1